MAPPHHLGPPNFHRGYQPGGGLRYGARPYVIVQPVVEESLHSFTTRVGSSTFGPFMMTTDGAIQQAVGNSSRFPGVDVFLHDNTTGANWTFRNGQQVASSLGAPPHLPSAPDVPSTIHKDLTVNFPTSHPTYGTPSRAGRPPAQFPPRLQDPTGQPWNTPAYQACIGKKFSAIGSWGDKPFESLTPAEQAAYQWKLVNAQNECIAQAQSNAHARPLHGAIGAVPQAATLADAARALALDAATDVRSGRMAPAFDAIQRATDLAAQAVSIADVRAKLPIQLANAAIKDAAIEYVQAGGQKAFGSALGAAPVVPNATFRKDVFLSSLKDSSGGFSVAVATPAEVAQCWTGNPNRAGELVRVWKKPQGTWPGGPDASPMSSLMTFAAEDLFAIPASWTDPDTTAACWQKVAPTARQNVNVDASEQSYTSQQWSGHASTPRDKAIAQLDQQFSGWFYSALDAASRKVMWGAWLDAAVAASPGGGGGLNALVAIPVATKDVYAAMVALTSAHPSGATAGTQFVSAWKGGCINAALAASKANTLATIAKASNPDLCALIKAWNATDKSKGPDKGGATPTDPLSDPAMKAALTAYADALKDDSILIVGAFFPTDADATPARIALFIAGSKCPVAVNDARKAGTLLAVIAKSKPDTFCSDLAPGGPKPADTGMSGGEKAAAAGLALLAIVVIARANRKSVRPKKRTA